ncbi:MAG: Holliday junction resolvase RuvX [Acidobacteria bacterium]|nr:Holliday junction resolvase RuvX [Acidobacteriota bacterium]
MQDKKSTNQPDFTDISNAPRKGRLLSLDLGTKKVGIAVCDETQFTVRRVAIVKRKGWKKFLLEIIAYIAEFDAKALILGLPYNFDGTESDMSREARRLARNFSLSLEIPVYLHDERVSTFEARANLWELGLEGKEVKERLDSEAAAIILEDFIQTRNMLIG